MREKLQRALSRVLHSIGRVQSHTLLTLIYLVLWVPVGLLARIFSDWLRLKASARSQWRPRPDRLDHPSSLREPY